MILKLAIPSLGLLLKYCTLKGSPYAGNRVAEKGNSRKLSEDVSRGGWARPWLNAPGLAMERTAYILQRPESNAERSFGAFATVLQSVSL